MVRVSGSQHIPQQKVSKNTGTDQVDTAAKGMEKLFIKFLVDELRKSNNEVDIFGETVKNDFFEGELYDEYAKAAADRGDFGIAKLLKEHINRSNMIGRKK